MSTLSSDDTTIVGVFILVSVLFPFLIGYKMRGKSFLEMTFAGRNLGFISMALTMFLSNNGSAQLTGLAGWAVHSGLGIYAKELVGSFGLLTLGWIFMPVYIASGVNNTIDYANKRFGGKRIGIVMVILMLFINLLSKFSVELQTAHIMLYELYELSPTSINILLILEALIILYPGGLYSLVYTNNLQFLFFLVGIPVIFVFSYSKFTSWQEIQLRYQKSWPNTTILSVLYPTDYKYTHCGIPDFHSLDLIRDHNDQSLPWPGMIFGIYIISVYTFCIDQSILQYCLGAKNIVNAKEACIVSSFLKILTIFLVIPGFIARVLYTDIVACADPRICIRACGKRSGCSDLALPQLFKNLVPDGWRGPVLVAFMAATLTSLAATFHASSTIFVLNLYRPLRHGVITELECTIVSKSVEIVQAFLGIVLVKAIDQIPRIDDFIQQIYSTMTPPLVAVYVTAIFWDKVTEVNAFRALVLGSVIAVIRLVWKLSYGFIPCGDETSVNVPEIIANFHDLHFAVFLFVICASFIVISGSMTDAIHDIHLYRLVFWTRYKTQKRLDIDKVSVPFFKHVNTTQTSYLVQMKSATFDNKKNITSGPETKTIEVRKSQDKGTSSTIPESDVDPKDYDFMKAAIQEEAQREKQKDAFYGRSQDTGTSSTIPGSDVDPKDYDCMKAEIQEHKEAERGKPKGSFYAKPLTDEDLQAPWSTRALVRVKELPSETQTLNMMLTVLLLSIAFVMGFFN